MKNGDFLIKAINSYKVLIDNQATLVREDAKGNRQSYATQSEIKPVPDNITTQGNTFNSGNNLVKLENGKIPTTLYTQPDISNLATKEELAAIPGFKRIVVDSLPTENIDKDAVYFVRTPDGGDQNVFVEYIQVENKWEILGTAKINLDGYATTVMLNDYLKSTDAANTYATKTELNQTIGDINTILDRINGEVL